MSAVWVGDGHARDYVAVEVHVSTDPSFTPTHPADPGPPAWVEFCQGFGIGLALGVLAVVTVGCLVLLAGL